MQHEHLVGLLPVNGGWVGGGGQAHLLKLSVFIAHICSKLLKCKLYRHACLGIKGHFTDKHETTERHSICSSTGAVGVGHSYRSALPRGTLTSDQQLS